MPSTLSSTFTQEYALGRSSNVECPLDNMSSTNAVFNEVSSYVICYRKLRERMWAGVTICVTKLLTFNLLKSIRKLFEVFDITSSCTIS